ncbi:MerR family transcriptional regulator [Burkholderia stagnalis]
MKIGEVAARSGVSRSRIRFYEKHGLLPAARRSENGYRDYPDAMVRILEFIGQAQELGFSLKEIGAALPAMDSPAALDTILPALEQKLSDVEAHIATSQSLRGKLLQLIAEQKDCMASRDVRRDTGSRF